MTGSNGSRAAPAVTVVLCDGHRCRALRGRTDTGVPAGETSTLLGALSDRVRRTRHAVLIRSECLGVCTRAPAVWLIRRDGSSVAGQRSTLFGPVEKAVQVRGLLDAVAAAEQP